MALTLDLETTTGLHLCICLLLMVTLAKNILVFSERCSCFNEEAIDLFIQVTKISPRFFLRMVPISTNSTNMEDRRSMWQLHLVIVNFDQQISLFKNN